MTPFNRHNKLSFNTIALITLLIGIFTTSCEDNRNEFIEATGSVTPVIIIDPSITSPTASTLSDMGCEVPRPEQFSIAMSDVTEQYSGHWNSLTDFSTTILYRAGQYTMTAQYDADAEGFNRPHFKGTADFEVVSGANTQVMINCKVANTPVRVNYAEALSSVLSHCELTLHSTSGGAFFQYPADETRPLFINPGDIGIIADITMLDGRSVMINPAWIRGALEAHEYSITVDVDTDGPDPVLTFTITGNDEPTCITLNDDLLNGTPPSITPVGFEPGQPIVNVEGVTPDYDIAMNINGANITNVLLSTRCPSLIAKGFPPEIDLINPSKEALDYATALGLGWDGRTISFDELLSQIDYSVGDETAIFTVVACDAAGRVNSPCSIVVETRDPEIKIVGDGSAIVGRDEATITLSTPALDLHEHLAILISNNQDHWADTGIISITPSPTGDNTHRVTFSVPDDNTDVDIRVLYCGKFKGNATVKRVSPTYTITVDPFAYVAKVKVNCDESDLIPGITRYIELYNGTTKYAIFNRDEDNGIVEIIGLEAQNRYTMRGSVLPHPKAATDYCAETKFTTETPTPIPNGDFEDSDKSIRYANLPSGGRYSQTIVEIFNRQNTTTYDVAIPRGWTSVNAKTFCTDAKTRNTWYMQPSTQIVGDASSGNNAVLLTNVAWDTNGEAIPDYKQIGMPYLAYNPYIPHIAHRAAGRLWLGAYSFNPSTGTEAIIEGIPFNSRPTSLTGSYKYLPGAVNYNERALARVKVWGRVNGQEMLIASAETRLSVSPDYKTFTVPLTYPLFGVKATKICVLIASSADIGSIDYESAHITTTPDAVTATSTGNRLWIDYLSLTY